MLYLSINKYVILFASFIFPIYVLLNEQNKKYYVWLNYSYFILSLYIIYYLYIHQRHSCRRAVLANCFGSTNHKGANLEGAKKIFTEVLVFTEK